MHVLEMITPSRVGGAETQVLTITRELTMLGDAVSIFCPQGRPFVDYLRHYGMHALSWKTWGKIDPKTLIGIIHVIRSQRVDVVHTHLTSATFIGSLAARLTGRRCVATVHGFTSAFWYRHAHRIIAVSDAVKDHLVAQGMPAEKIQVIHNGIAVELYTPQPLSKAKAACGFDPAQIRLGVFGRLVTVKGHGTVIEALPQLLKRYPTARLSLVGDGREREAMTALTRRLGVEAQVDFHGFVPDPRPLLAACDLVMMPSRQEGLGLAAIEAMALERPVIATRVGGLSEVIDDGVSGLLIPPDDATALLGAILTVLADPDYAARLGACGRLRAQQRFHACRQVMQLRRVLMPGEVSIACKIQPDEQINGRRAW